ncbi:hypothetical protein ACVWZL_008354 [Bradyrhizobium sp. GM2.4]
MTCAGPFDGSSFRANSSLAPIVGSFGLASGGSGFGLTLPLSWASAVAGGQERHDEQERGEAAGTHVDILITQHSVRVKKQSFR